MKKILFYALLACSAAFAPMGPASAAERGTADEASALVKKGIVYENKSSYVEKLGDGTLIGVGIYK